MTATEQEQLFCRCLDAHQGLLWRAVRAFAESPQDRQDLLQDILLQLWMSLPTFRGDSKESTWLYRLAFNTALVWQRKQKRLHTKHQAYSLIASQIETAAQPATREESIEQLYVAIRQLPKLDTSLALMLLDGLSYRQISEVLGISESNVGVRLHRIRKQLTEQMKGRSDEL